MFRENNNHENKQFENLKLKSIFELHSKDRKVEETIRLAEDFAHKLKTEYPQAEIYIIGGFVRDNIINHFYPEYNLFPKDIDLEIHKIKQADLESFLKKYFDLNLVGQEFGVYKVYDLDIALPRRENKTGLRHRDFDVEIDENISKEEAFKRRDFTMNALGWDVFTGDIIDVYGGVEDIQNKRIKHVDTKTFVEDPLRVLRAMQFSARFDFEIDQETIDLCRSLDLQHLSSERIFEEFQKLFIKGKNLERGLDYAKELGILKQILPEIDQFSEIPQAEIWHPEGNLWEHTKQAVVEAKKLAQIKNLDKEHELLLVWSALFHDLGKISTTKLNKKGYWISPGHARESLKYVKDIWKRLKMPNTLKSEQGKFKFKAKLLKLIEHHDYLIDIDLDKLNVLRIRRLSLKLAPATIAELLDLILVDHLARQSDEMKETDKIDFFLTDIYKRERLKELALREGILFKAFEMPVKLSDFVNSIEDLDKIKVNKSNLFKYLREKLENYCLNTEKLDEKEIKIYLFKSLVRYVFWNGKRKKAFNWESLIDEWERKEEKISILSIKKYLEENE